MLRSASRLTLAVACLSLSCLAPRLSLGAVPGTPLADGTRIDRWTLRNGLRVVARHVPGARTSAVTLGYRLGMSEDPPKQEGLAELAAQVAFTARAGDVPQRQLGELDQLRPSGWNLKVTPHVTELTEAAPHDLFAGVLHQVGQRLRGFTTSDTHIDEEKVEVRDRFKQNLDANVEGALSTLSEQLSTGQSPERAMRYATGEGLDGVKGPAVRELLRERVVPSNSVLALVGDFDGMDLHTLLDKEVGDIPAGTAQPPIVWGRLASSRGSVTREDLKAPAAVVGIVAPPLTDSTHASFTMFAIAIASVSRTLWAKAESPLSHRFQFSLATDPELVRFYPPLTQEVPDPGEALLRMLLNGREKIVDTTTQKYAVERALWLAGGPLPADLAPRAASDPTVTNSLSTIHAALELYGDEPFWARYRARIVEAPFIDQRPLFEWFAEPHHQVAFTMKPGKSAP